MLSYSTALLNFVAETGPWKDALANGRIEIYDGAVPVSADAAKTGTLLVTITKNGDGSGLNFSQPAEAGLLSGDPSEEWFGEAVASGTARYFRYLTDVADVGGASAAYRRIQGTCGVSGADMNLPTVAFDAGSIHRVPADQRSIQV